VEKTVIRKALLAVLHTKYYSCDQMKKNYLDWVRGTYGREKKCIQRFGGETWEKETFLKT
jgi:hypothetical protein